MNSAEFLALADEEVAQFDAEELSRLAEKFLGEFHIAEANDRFNREIDREIREAGKAWARASIACGEARARQDAES